MNLRFDEDVDFLQFGLAFGRLYCIVSREHDRIQRILDEIALFANFDRYSRTFRGEDYYNAIPDDDGAED